MILVSSRLLKGLNIPKEYHRFANITKVTSSTPVKWFHSTRNVQFQSPSAVNDDILKKVFDDQKFYNSFNKHSEESFKFLSDSNVGLFKNQYLKSPDGLVQFSKNSLKTAKKLVSQMLDDVKTDQAGKLTYIRKLDQLSDVLCKAIDVAEFIRNTHTKQAWIDAAQKTHEILFEYMNQLNTNVELYKYLAEVLNDSSVTSHLSEEEIKVGEYLKEDFEKSGIHMDDVTRKNFVELTQEISVIGANYSHGLQSLDSIWCDVEKSEFDKMNNPALKAEIYKYQLKSPTVSANKGKSNHIVLIPLIEYIPYAILTECPSESIRRKVWIAYHNASKQQIELLNAFIKYRAVLARMLGYESYAHHQLQHKMAKTPENVKTFLDKIQKNLIENKATGLMNEIRSLYKFKDDADKSLSDEEIISEVKPWDRDYLLNKLQLDLQKLIPNPDINEIKGYLSIGTVMSGLNKLFNNIYKIQLIPVATGEGETWDKSQVRKIKVLDMKDNKVLGYLYIDFWSPKVFPSHFTIVCSRKLNNDINIESKDEVQKQVHLDETENYQLPIISIVFNFNKPSSIFAPFTDSNEPTLLGLEQVETIFHEMGHAMHSMIGKTNLQNLSGTRAVTDFVELPSVLMESFAKDPRVVCNFATHYQTGEPLTKELFDIHQKQRFLLYETEIFMQSKMALLDQVLHSPETVEKIIADFENFDSTPIYHNLESSLKIFSDKWSTWHGKFLHLFSYGSVYYSYLLDRAIADKVYKGLFLKDPWNPAAGEKYKNSVLKWGGTKDPWACLADALDNDQLRKGDSKAMEIIGSDFK